MRQLLAPLILFLFIHCTVKAQLKFIPATILKMDNQKQNGYIGDEKWYINPEMILFKLHEDAKTTKYTPLDIKAFTTGGVKYESAIVRYDISPRETNLLTLNRDLIWETDTVFLQTLIEGDKNLYVLNTMKYPSVFFIKDGDSIVSLIYKKFIKDGTMDNRSIHEIGENNTYKNQLYEYLKDCGAILEDIQDIQYDADNLVKLFVKYYGCTNKKMSYRITKNKAEVRYSLFGGLCINRLNFYEPDNSTAFNHLTKANFKLNPTFTFGIKNAIQLPKTFKRWSLDNEIQFSYYGGKAHYEYNAGTSSYLSDVNLLFAYARLNSMIRRHIIPNENWDIFMQAGVSLGIKLLEKNVLTEDYTYYQVRRQTDTKALDETEPTDHSYILGIGVKKNKIGAEVRYDKSGGPSPYLNLSSPVSRYYLLISYELK